MHMKGNRISRQVLIVATAVLVMSSCNRTRNNPGYDYFPDMYYSQGYETYAPNPNFSDELTMRTPPDGTIPLEEVPFQYEKSEEGLLLAGRELENLLEPEQEVIEAGAGVYKVFCMMCHGEAGDGKGHLFTGGKYPYPPANLLQEKTLGRPDGELYHIITLGYGIMGAHGPMMTQQERWEVITYIREVLQANAK